MNIDDITRKNAVQGALDIDRVRAIAESILASKDPFVVRLGEAALKNLREREDWDELDDKCQAVLDSLGGITDNAAAGEDFAKRLYGTPRGSPLGLEWWLE